MITRLAACAWATRAVVTTLLVLAWTLIIDQGLLTSSSWMGAIFAFLASALWLRPLYDGQAARCWRRWTTRRVHARAGLWLATCAPVVLILPSHGHSTANLISLAMILAWILGRWGPRLGPGTTTWWQRTPWGTAWRWMCPPVDPTTTPGWTAVAHNLCTRFPDVEGQFVMAHTPPRLRLMPMNHEDDPSFAWEGADPMVVVRPDYTSITRCIAHGRQRHMMIYVTPYGGVHCTNDPQLAWEESWLEAWLAIVGDRDPQPGAAWPLAKARSAHAILAQARASAQR